MYLSVKIYYNNIKNILTFIFGHYNYIIKIDLLYNNLMSHGGSANLYGGNPLEIRITLKRLKYVILIMSIISNTICYINTFI